jgi:hypothetical protein
MGMLCKLNIGNYMNWRMRETQVEDPPLFFFFSSPPPPPLLFGKWENHLLFLGVEFGVG